MSIPKKSHIFAENCQDIKIAGQMTFTERIRQLREERRMPQRQFLCKASANQTGLSLPIRSQKSRKQFDAALEIDTLPAAK